MKLLVTGAGGMLAQAVLKTAHTTGHEVVAFDRGALDITNSEATRRALDEHRPDAVLHCAGYTRVDDAEHDQSGAFAVNTEGTRNIARAAALVGARLVYPSTDYVFGGTSRVPYRPDHPPSPLNVYGRSKLAGEEAAREAGSWLVIRTSWLYGAGGRNFVSTILTRARDREPLRVVNDQVGSPTWTVDLSGVLLALLERNASSGIYHACNRGETSWYGFAQTALELAAITADLEPVSSKVFVRPAARPHYSVLDCRATEAVIGALPSWQESLALALEAGI